MLSLSRRHLLALTGTVAVTAGIAIAAPVLGAAAAASPVQSITVNGVRLAYRRHGSRRRRPLVFLHGYALNGTGPIYDALFRNLVAEFDIYALDMRGHGGSASAAADWSQATIADDLAAFAKALKLDRATFAGHSLGAFTGMFAELRHPGTFSSLILLATSPAGGGGAPPSVRDAFIKRGKDRTFLRETFSGMYRRREPGAVERAVDAVTLVPATVHDAFYSNFAATKIIDELSRITVPVLVLNGAKDNVVPPIDQYRTALAIPRAKEITFPDQGHMLPIEAPEITAREMLSFVGDLSGARR